MLDVMWESGKCYRGSTLLLSTIKESYKGETRMTANQPIITLDLSKYVDTSGERPVLRGSELPIATLAYRALSCSWGLDELAYQFSLSEIDVLAGLLYYTQYRDQVDALEDSSDLEFEAKD
jgi:hypothetical protein